MVSADHDNLMPTEDKAVFLLVMPPRSLRHKDQPRHIQIQRIVQQKRNASGGFRIKPIFNLETHRFQATKIIELEDKDATVAEFHPAKSIADEPSSARGSSDANHKRRRARSIEHKTGAFGGRIKSEKNSLGLVDMTVIGSEERGSFLFQCSDGQALSWQKETLPDGSCWTLKSSLGGSHIMDERGLAALESRVAANTSENAKSERSHEPVSQVSRQLHSHYPITRTNTSATLASQYTTEFVNESQLSGLTNSPQLSGRHGLPIRQHDGRLSSDFDSELDEDEENRTTLSTYPQPHLSVVLPANPDRKTSMHQITLDQYKMHRILLCGL